MCRKRTLLVLITVFICAHLNGCGVSGKSHLIDSPPAAPEAKAANPFYHYSLGVLLRLDGNMEEATEEMRKAVAADPESANGGNAEGGCRRSCIGLFDQ